MKDELDFDFLKTDDLDDLLGGEAPPRPVVTVSEIAPVADLSDVDPALKDDLNASRSTLRAQQELMMQMAMNMAPEVMMAEHPKMVEAFAKLMAQMTAASKALVDVHKVTKDAKTTTSITHTQQIKAEKVFIGTSSELMDKLGTRQDQQEREIEGQVIDYDPEKDRASE
jgi:hypothetical protein